MDEFVRLLIVSSDEFRTLISWTSFWNKGYGEISVDKSETVTQFTREVMIGFGIHQKISDKFVCVGGPEPSRTPRRPITTEDRGRVEP